MIFLMGLNDQYSPIRTQILLMNPLPSISKVFALVIQDERQRNAGLIPCDPIPQPDPVALAAANSSKRVSTNNSRRKENTRDDQRPICSHCNIRGHIVDRCYKIHGYPQGYRTHN